MNKISLLIAVAVGFFLESVLGDTTPNATSKIENFIFMRCRHYSTDAVSYDDIKEHAAQFTDYMKLSFSHLPEGKKQFCEEDQFMILKVLRLLVKDMKPCLPKEERYLPEFLTSSMTGFLNFLCGDGGKNIDSFFSTLGKECMQNLKAQAAGAEVGDCFNKLSTPLKGVVPKDNLCEDLSSAKKCFGETLSRYCPDFRAFRSLNSEFFKAVRKPCNAASTLGISSLILMVGVLFSTKFNRTLL